MTGETSPLEARRAALPSSYRLFYENPVVVDHTEGVWIHDATGTPLLDVYNNVPVVGHSNAHVADRVAAQLRTANTHTRYVYPSVAEYASRLESLFPAPLNKTIFTCSGSEAVDLALQVARFTTGHEGVIATSHAYHGTTAATHAVSPSLSRRFLDDRVALVDVPEDALAAGDAGEEFARRVREAIATLEARGVGFAALIMDQVLTSDGVFTDPVGFMAPVREAVRAAGGVFIADEVQSGFGRTGTHMWGFDRHGIVPDLVILGKPMGNGLPIAALVGTAELLNNYGDTFRYFNTFGGNPVCIAAADAVLDEIERLDILANVVTTGALLRQGLADTLTAHGLAANVRGIGLIAGGDLSASRETPAESKQLVDAIVNGLRNRGVLISSTGPRGTVLKVRPPLVFQPEHAERVLSALDDTLTQLAP
jgi:4-aminobutyrate aminotransferase-like enzyme